MIPWQLDQMYDFLDFNTLVKVAPNKGILARRIGRMQYGIRVPEDFKTLKEAVQLVQGNSHLDVVKYSCFTTIVVGEGNHEVGYLEIFSAVNIVGDPTVARKDITILGGILFAQNIGVSHLQHLTIRSNEIGVNGRSSFTMKDVLVDQCGIGICADGIVVVECTDVEVRRCTQSGVLAYGGGSITMVGKTKVTDNCTEGRDEFGLKVYSSSSTIQLVYPLTKELVSTNNRANRANWGAKYCDVKRIKNISKAEMKEAKEARARGEIRVPQECTLVEAVLRVDDHFTTVVLGRGVHKVDGILEISSANIVGDPNVAKEHIVVLGGIAINKGRHGTYGTYCSLKHLTIKGTIKGNGVRGRSSFEMEDVLVERGGVKVIGDVIAKCTDIEVHECVGSGVFASGGASIILIGNTKVHHNCTDGTSYGLQADHNSSILSVFPLTKETASFDNDGGRFKWQWGPTGQITIISPFNMKRRVAKSKGEVRVPEDCKTLKDAVSKVHRYNLRTIVVGEGIHHVGTYLKIPSTMIIRGVTGKTTIDGGIWFEKGSQYSHLQHLTIQARHSGVYGHSPFTMEDVLVEKCGRYGIFALSDARCNNVEVRKCKWGGIVAMGKATGHKGHKGHKGPTCITLDNVNVHHNCTDGHSWSYGLYAYGSSIMKLSSIQKVSHDNGGGGNYCRGCIDKNGCTLTDIDPYVLSRN